MIKLMLKRIFALSICVILGTISTMPCFASNDDGEKLIIGTTGIGRIHVEVLVTEKADEDTPINVSNINTVLRQIGQTVSNIDGTYSLNISGLEPGKWYVAKVNENGVIRRIEFYCATQSERLTVYRQIADVNKSGDDAFNNVKSIINNNAEILNWDLTIFNLLEDKAMVAGEIIDMCAANTDGSSLESDFNKLMNTLYSAQTELNEKKAEALLAVNTKKWDKIKEALNSYSDVLIIYGYNHTGFASLHPENQTALCQKLAKTTYKDLADFADAANLKIKEMKKPNSSGGSSGGSGGGSGGSSGSGKSSGVSGLGGVVIQVSGNVFNDLESVEWAKDSITYLYDNKIVSGIGDGNFAPNQEVTREEFLKMLILATNLSDKTAVAEFSDISKSDWSYEYIASAYKIGVASGVGNGVFGKKDPLTRQDAATFVYRTIRHLGLSYEEPDGKTRFTDNDEIAEYALDAVNVLNKLGIINGMGDGSFRPKETITRAQTAVMVHNLMKVIDAKR